MNSCERCCGIAVLFSTSERTGFSGGERLQPAAMSRSREGIRASSGLSLTMDSSLLSARGYFDQAAEILPLADEDRRGCRHDKRNQQYIFDQIQVMFELQRTE